MNIPLSNGGYALVDDDVLLPTVAWRNDRGYAVYSNGKTRYKMHRLISEAPIGQLVDHINGNKLDNRRSNLRLCNHTQNMWNQKISKNNKSGYKGVSWYTARSRWKAQIRVNNRTIFLGLFISLEDASAAYSAASIKHHGDFASIVI